MDSQNLDEQYLLDYLREEFRLYPELRIRRTPQDHEEGVMVKSESREYFFPVDWIRNRRFSEVQRQIQKIREVLPDRF